MEMTTGKGFADVVYIPDKTSQLALIIELKRNKCAESAIAQIREKQYFQSLSHYRGNLLLTTPPVTSLGPEAAMLSTSVDS